MEKVLGKNSIDFFYKPVHRFVRQDDGDVSPGAQAQAVAEQHGGRGAPARAPSGLRMVTSFNKGRRALSSHQGRLGR